MGPTQLQTYSAERVVCPHALSVRDARSKEGAQRIGGGVNVTGGWREGVAVPLCRQAALTLRGTARTLAT